MEEEDEAFRWNLDSFYSIFTSCPSGWCRAVSSTNHELEELTTRSSSSSFFSFSYQQPPYTTTQFNTNVNTILLLGADPICHAQSSSSTERESRKSERNKLTWSQLNAKSCGFRVSSPLQFLVVHHLVQFQFQLVQYIHPHLVLADKRNLFFLSYKLLCAMRASERVGYNTWRRKSGQLSPPQKEKKKSKIPE